MYVTNPKSLKQFFYSVFVTICSDKRVSQKKCHKKCHETLNYTTLSHDPERQSRFCHCTTW